MKAINNMFLFFIVIGSCEKMINDDNYGDYTIRRICKLSWHFENCLGVKPKGKVKGFQNFWKPCCYQYGLPFFKCEKMPKGNKSNLL